MAKAKEQMETVTVRVIVPKDCKKRNISIDALDRYTREIAEQTWVTIDDKPLLCRGLKVVEQGGEECLQLVIRAGSFEFVSESTNDAPMTETPASDVENEINLDGSGAVKDAEITVEG